jgi:hypothetical protein
MKREKIPRILGLALWLLLSPPAWAQDLESPEAPAGESSPRESSADVEDSREELQAEESPFGDEEALAEHEGLTEEKIIEMDIRSSTLRELAAWCRTLGLSEGGGREDLAGRLRNHYQLGAGSAGRESGGQRIVIESARSTEYFTLDVVDEEYARLRGNVIISLKDDAASHRISAQEILYNRSRNQVTARGKVSYVKEEGDTIETFRGESITVNLDSWATVLTEGISERALSGEETTYRFAGTVISRSEEEVTILKDAKITNASTADSYWSLNATKLWLLPGSDFALRNAVIKVGEIPLFYIPFFYYPADEVIFHPVLGYRSREGNFFQTTTYILGRPKSDDIKESSFTKILGSGAGMEKERQGIFLRSTGKKQMNPSQTSLKMLFDIYANLGGYFGAEAAIPQVGIFKDLAFSGGLGLTRDVMPVSQGGVAGFTPFPNNDGKSEWNSSRLFSWTIPLRYRFKITGSLSGKGGSLSWDLPYYSDPFVDRDFLDRSESMDWIRVIQEGASVNEEDADETLLGAYEWRLNGRISLSPPKILSPYLTTLSLSNLSSTFMFNYRDSQKYRTEGNTYSPSRQFYFPDKLTILSLGLNLGGTPLTLRSGNFRPAEPAAAAPELEDPFEGIGTPRSPWEEMEEEDGDQQKDPWDLRPPALAQRFELAQVGGPQFSVDYRINPAAVSELQFRTGTNHAAGRYHWAEAEDVDWGDVSSILSTVRGDANTSLNLSDPAGMYSNVFTLSTSGAYQGYLYANREAEEFNGSSTNELRNALSRVYNANFFTTNYDNVATLKPLYWDPVWGNSNLSYSFKGLLAKSEFDPNSIPQSSAALPDDIWDADPHYEIKYGAWDKEKLDSHQFSANLNANVMDMIQNFTLAMALPPKDSTLSGNLTTRIWFTEFNLSMQVLEPWKEERKVEPLHFTGTIKFGDQGFLRQYMVYNSKDREYRTLTTTLNYWGFTAGFTAIHGVPYEFVYDPNATTGNGWVQQGTADLHPQEIRFGFNKSLPSTVFWRDRLTLSLNANTNLLIDLQRYTYSKFDATMRLNLEIKNVLDLSFSATSENAVIYRYLRDIPAFQLPIPSVGEQNIFKDLFNSFRFDDDDLRTESGFKLKSLNFSATHHMGDWNATLALTLAPYLDQPAGGIPSYKFNTQFSFLVQWLPINEIKSEITIDKDKWITK